MSWHIALLVAAGFAMPLAFEAALCRYLLHVRLWTARFYGLWAICAAGSLAGSAGSLAGRDLGGWPVVAGAGAALTAALSLWQWSKHRNRKVAKA